jgi:hypothetical protein
MRQLGGDIDVARLAGQRVQVVAEAFPLPAQAFVQRRAGDVFHTLHQLHQPLAVVGMHRGEADAAVAHHRGGHAMPAAGLHAGVPAGLAVVVGVDVDEAGCHQLAAGVDLVAAGAGHAAHRGDAAVVHRHIGLAQRAAVAVGEFTAADDEVMAHGPGPLLQLGAVQSAPAP